MRLVQITIPAGKRQAILDKLDDEEIDYVVTEETGNREYTAVVYFPLPVEAVEDVLDSLRDAGLADDAYTVIIDAETVISRRFEKLKERYAEEEEETAGRISREELRARAEDLAPRTSTFFIMTVLSAIVATCGLLLDSPAVVVGSMVIAPLIGPAMATSVGTVVDEHDLFVRGVKLQLAGFALAIASAAGFAALVKTIHLVPPGLDVIAIEQVRGRLSPDFLSLAVALGAGVAGAISLSTGVSTALVGVMIAAALVPPTAVIGIGIAWGLPFVVLGSSVLVLVNVLSINLAALLVLWRAGYRPENWFQLSEAKAATLKRVAVLAGAIALLSVFLAGVTYASYQSASFEQTAEETTESVLSQGEYQNLEILEFQVHYGDSPFPFREPERVTVTVGRPGTGGYPALPETIKQRIAERTGRSVAVEVRYVEVGSTYSSKGSVGSKPAVSTAASSTSSTFSSSVMLI